MIGPDTVRESQWEPILEEREQACGAVRAIAESLKRPSVPSKTYRRDWGWEGSTLFGGRAGLSLFFAYVSRWLNDPEYVRLAQHNLDRALNAARYKTLGSSLYHGFTGIAWVLVHLNGWIVDYDILQFKREVYEALRVFLEQSPVDGLVADLMRGDVGIGVYLLENIRDAEAVDLLTAIIDRLANAAQYSEAGVAWLTNPEIMDPKARAIFPAGTFNMGVAHGLPGTIAFLALAAKAGIKHEQTHRMLQQAIDWLLSQELDEDCESAFPTSVTNGVPSSPARLAWCYGDIGIATAILAAGRHVRHPVWEATALRIGARAANRSVRDAGVQDAGLCHGSTGIAHLFNRMYQATREPAFKRASQRWFKNALQYRRPGTWPGGFAAATLSKENEGRWEAFPGFLAGAAGIGLAFLSAYTSIEPSWDRALLTSIPPRLE